MRVIVYTMGRVDDRGYSGMVLSVLKDLVDL